MRARLAAILDDPAAPLHALVNARALREGLLTSAGDYVVSFIVSRYVDGKDWLQKTFAKKKENAAIEQ